MNKTNLIVFIGTIVLIGLTDCDIQQSEQKNRSKPVYKVENAVLDSVAYTLTASTDAPDGMEFAAELNNQTVSAKSYKQKLEFNVQQCFDPMYDAGGRDYQVKFSCTGGSVSQSDYSLPYWPKLIARMECPDTVSVWNGSTDKFTEPQVYVNYETDVIVIKEWGEVFDENDNKIDEYQNWDFAGVISYLSDKNHAGTFVRYYGKVIPVRNNTQQDALADLVEVDYLCLEDILVINAAVEQLYDKYQAVCCDASGDTAGGRIVYEWQMADSPDGEWTTIAETGSAHSVSKNEIGKYVRVKLTQNYCDVTQDTITTAPRLMKHIFKTSEVKLKYNKILTTDPNDSKPSISDLTCTAVNTFGEKVTDVTLTFSGEGYTRNGLPYSDYVSVTIGKAGYEDMQADVFITMQNVITDEDMPSLSEDISNITLGKVKFDVLNNIIEYSLDGGLVWQNMSDGEFDAAAGSTLLVRKKSLGLPNVSGYLMESEPHTITVQTKHIGIQTQMSGIDADVKEPQLVLESTYNNGQIQVTAMPKDVMSFAYELGADFIWMIDGIPAGNIDYAVVNQNVMYLDKSKMLSGEVYQVSVRFRLYYVIDDVEYDALKMSSQISITVTAE